jgi:hypothetical protein
MMIPICKEVSALVLFCSAILLWLYILCKRENLHLRHVIADLKATIVRQALQSHFKIKDG